MGREARQAKPTRVKLERADYFELRALIRDVEAVQFDALKAARHFEQQAQQAIQTRNAKFEALAKAHGFDAAKTWGWDDTTCELVEAPI